MAEEELSRTPKGRVEIELDDLKTKNEKLGNLLGKVKTKDFPNHQKLLDKMSNEQKNLLKKQYKVQKEYIRILEKRLRIWVDE